MTAIKCEVDYTEDNKALIPPVEILPDSNNSGTNARAAEDSRGKLDSVAKEDRDSLQLEVIKVPEQWFEPVERKSVGEFEEDLFDTGEKKFCLDGNASETGTEIELLKGKIDSLAQENEDLKLKLSILTGKIKSYFEQDVLLEDERRRNKSLRAEMSFYKALSEEKSRQNDRLSMKIVKLEYDLSSARNQLFTTEIGNKRLVEEGMLLENNIALEHVNYVELSDPPPPTFGHFLEKAPAHIRRRCVGCYRNAVNNANVKYARANTRQTRTRCSQCKKHFCLECYNATHRICDFKRL
ncbi:hypothetical protein KIN20_026804 [Parelaphostrongylus tenuis]|uniref:Uncharacterized protein n=1 Tax=Parelaphostrongylus tenuis TaxID=148309 RepID=A0AAD5WDE4_PARTN|nr:hypothetical protein KIN20_026804 [Parelaphostrongylus tenuis]